MNVLDGFSNEAKPAVVLHGEISHGLAKSLVECAVLAYKDRAVVEQTVSRAPQLERFEWFEAVGKSFDTQAFACVLPGHVIVAFRGTSSIQDFVTDAALLKRPLKGFHGQVTPEFEVHAGFQRALNAIWSDERSARREARSTIGPALHEFFTDLAARHPQSRLWLTGHSLGAALATITVARIQLTDNAPFHNRVGALVTLGSPRALDKAGAAALERALGPDRIVRIYRSMDPVSVVPYRGFDHVSGERRAFVSTDGKLVMGARGGAKWADRLVAFLRWIEDQVGSTLIPGQHGNLGALLAHHGSDGYLRAVAEYSPENKLRRRDNIIPVLKPVLKLGGLGTTAGVTANEGLAKLQALLSLVN